MKLEYITVQFRAAAGEDSGGDDATRDCAALEAVDYYDKHKNEFMTSEPAATQPGGEGAATKPDIKPPMVQRLRAYDEVRDEIIGRLTDEKAAKLGDEIVKAVQGMLIEHEPPVFAMAEEEGYRKPAGGLARAGVRGHHAEDSGTRYHVLLPVSVFDKWWQDVSDLQKDRVLGGAMLAGDRATAAQYIMSVRELKPAKTNPLVVHHPQVGLPSLPLEVRMNRDRVIFRVTAVDPMHTPRRAGPDRGSGDPGRATRGGVQESEGQAGILAAEGADGGAGQGGGGIVHGRAHGGRDPAVGV